MINCSPLVIQEGFVGELSGGGTPGPISNPAVKSTSTDGSMRVAACERRSLPTFPSYTFLFDKVEFPTCTIPVRLLLRRGIPRMKLCVDMSDSTSDHEK